MQARKQQRQRGQQRRLMHDSVPMFRAPAGCATSLTPSSCNQAQWHSNQGDRAAARNKRTRRQRTRGPGSASWRAVHQLSACQGRLDRSLTSRPSFGLRRCCDAGGSSKRSQEKAAPAGYRSQRYCWRPPTPCLASGHRLCQNGSVYFSGLYRCTTVHWLHRGRARELRNALGTGARAG